MRKRTTTQTIKLISDIVEEKRAKLLKKIIKRLADFSLNELNYLARILGIK